MCNLYEYDMTPEVMQTLKEHFSLVGTSYLDVLRGRTQRTGAVWPRADHQDGLACATVSCGPS